MQTQHARIMIAALHGRSGKTVITLGLLRALVRRGVAVQPFKKGPDFIDPGWHRLACKRVSRNLDRFFMKPEQIRTVISESAQGCELSIIEGAMGIYDGMDVAGSCSSAEIAKDSKTPVILVVDTTRMTRTTAALILGCQHFDPLVQIVGVILNRIRGGRHEQLIREAVEHTCGIPVIGAIPIHANMDIPDRHLGLISSEEAKATESTLDKIAEVVAKYVDLDAFIALAQEVEPLEMALTPSLVGTDAFLKGTSELPQTSEGSRVAGASEVSKDVGVSGGSGGSLAQAPQSKTSHIMVNQSFKPLSQETVAQEQTSQRVLSPVLSFMTESEHSSARPRIAVIQDASFCFYYQENLDALKDQGAELVFVNSLEDTALPPNIHALYIGGGFPEVFAAQLQANSKFRSSLKTYIEANLPVYAECGGLMYLGRSLEYEGHVYKMVGALELDIIMQEQRQAHGYSVLKAGSAQSWLEPGSVLRGHEYHHSKVVNLDAYVPLAFTMQRGHGIDGKHDGVCYKEVVAVYTHVNAFASPDWAKSLVKQACAYAKVCGK